MPPFDTAEEAMAGVHEDNINELKFSNRGFCCCCMPSRIAVKSNWWQRIATHDNSSTTLQNTSRKESRWFRGWNKVRQWSGLVARPKWKSFVRRFKKKRNGNFHYDYQDYSLNFDEGFDEELLNRSFYSRRQEGFWFQQGVTWEEQEDDPQISLHATATATSQYFELKG